MKTSDIEKLVQLSIRAREQGDTLNLCLVSAPGLGKTEIMAQVAKRLGYETRVVSCATMDPPDFKGFPVTETIDGRLRLSFATPSMWPTDPTSKGIIILEELNRSPSSVVQCVLSLGDARRGFDGYQLPEGWVIVANINPDGLKYDTSTLDPAVADRFRFVTLQYDRKTFLDYIRAAEWDSTLINFVSADLWKYRLPEDIKEGSGDLYTSPRTLSSVNAALRAGLSGDLERPFLEAIMGRVQAAQFYSFRHNETPVMVADLKRALKTSLKKLEKWSDPAECKNGMISVTTEDMVSNSKEVGLDILSAVALTIPVEHSVAMIRNMERSSGTPNLLESLFKHSPEVKKLFKGVHYAA